MPVSGIQTNNQVLQMGTGVQDVFHQAAFHWEVHNKSFEVLTDSNHPTHHRMTRLFPGTNVETAEEVTRALSPLCSAEQMCRECMFCSLQVPHIFHSSCPPSLAHAENTGDIVNLHLVHDGMQNALWQRGKIGRSLCGWRQ